MFAQTTPVTFEQTKSVLEKIGDAFFDGRSLLVFVICMFAALALGGLMAVLLRRLSRATARRADSSTDLAVVTRLRRLETWIILSIAVVRLLLIAGAVYLWWTLTHPQGSRQNAALGAGALAAILIGGAVSPLLRDFAFGVGMMAERWFGVGDLITIDFPRAQGVVERITLRSTRLRGMNGEVIWVANQTMNGVRVSQKGVWATALEIFAYDPDKATALIERTNKLLPGGMAMLVSPLEIVEVSQRDKDIWHITVIGETAPGREWIITDTAIAVLKQLDEKAAKPVLIVDPVARYADKEGERQIVRAVRNAKKKRRTYNYRRAVVSQSHKLRPAKKRT